MGISRQEYWSELPCPSPGDLPNPGMEPVSLLSSALAGEFSLPLAPPGKQLLVNGKCQLISVVYKINGKGENSWNSFSISINSSYHLHCFPTEKYLFLQSLLSVSPTIIRCP